jgi:nucleoside-diphosphate-sugar epimerase
VSAAGRNALIVGASGLVGGSLLDRLGRDPQWRLTTLSRRPPPLDAGVAATHLPVNLLDPEQCRRAAGELGETTHVFFCARAVEENYLIQVDANRLIVENLLDALIPAARDLRHIQIIHGMKWYGSNLGPYRTPAEESHPRLPGRNFYYEQLDALIARQNGCTWTWSTLRPHFVCGVSVGSPSNPLSTLGTYAAILKEVGEPLHFPGQQGAFDAALNVTDVRLLARAMEWAAIDPRCANEAFNIVNGDTFRWRDVWPLLAGHFGLPAGSVRPMSLRAFMADKQPVWSAIAARHGLRFDRATDVADWAFADVMFAGAWDQTASVAKAHHHGFNATVDTKAMLVEILCKYRELKILP